MRLLVIEDEADLAEGLRAGLGRAGYAVDLAGTGGEGLEKLSYTAYDLLLLDLNLPDLDGFEVCRQVRAGAVDGPTGPDVRILMLTARSSLASRVRGLDEGADDYLVKPFALAELLARVRALLRREGATPTPVLRVGPLTLDPARRTASRSTGRPGGAAGTAPEGPAERDLRLTNKEFGVLEYLMTRPGRVVSSEELLEHVWDENADPFTQTVRVTVGTLRRKLSVDGEEQLLETVVGRGYRMRDGS